MTPTVVADVMSTGKNPVAQPRSRPARDAYLTKAPSARTSLYSKSGPHTSSIPRRGEGGT